MGVNFTEEQQAVIDARDANILVSAAAGSGKTAVLVERIIQMISSGTDIDHLLVVTFTKAAASQMKEKITLAIQEKLEKEPENRHLQKQETLIHNAQITTIDSFCQYILRNNFNAIGLDPSFRVGDDGELKLLQEEVMQNMLEDEYEKAREGENEDFLYCMNYFGTGSSDKKAEEYINQLYRFSMSMPWPEDWLRERADDYLISGQEFDELNWVRNCVGYIKLSLNEAAKELNTAYRLCLEPDGPYYYADMLETEKDSVEAALRYNTYDELFEQVRGISFARLPGKKDDSVSSEKKEYAKDLRNSAKDRIKRLTEEYLALPSETVISQMELCDRAVKELCRLTIEYKTRFDLKKREKQLIDFADMEHFALQILVNHPGDTPSRVALEYREYYKEVMIDEYQDSNNVQELILKAIAGEEARESERFMVGDVKQSIYKFRLARPEIFMEKLESYDKAAGAKNRRIDLHRNFRSRKEVLEGTNYIFRRLMGKDLGGVAYDGDAELVAGASYDEPGYDMSMELLLVDGEDDGSAATGIKSDISDYDPKEKEALAIASRIHELIRADSGLRFKDIVILLRSNAGWDDVFKDILETQGIPAYIESKSGYFDTWEISVMLSLLTIIDNPMQDIPLVSVMHSSIGSFSDEELARIRIAIDADSALSECDSLYQGMTGLVKKDAESCKKLARFVALIEDFRERSVYTPVHELLQYIVDATGFENYIAAMPAGVRRKANLELLISKAADFERTSFKGLFHFVRYIEHLKVVQVDYGEAGIIDENANVVRIMSIHKSKGLEFPVVFVAGLSKKFNRRDTKGDMITDIDLGIGVKFVDTSLRVKYDTLKRIMIADKMDTDSLGEELRILYVALTRAKEKLIMTAYVKKLQDELIKAVKSIPLIAENGGLLPFSTRRGSSGFFDLLLAALITHPAFRDVLARYEVPLDSFNEYIEKNKNESVPAFSVKSINVADMASMLETENVRGIIRREDLDREAERDFDSELSNRLISKFKAGYAFESLSGLFTKTTVTELKSRMLEQEGELFSHEISFNRDAKYDEGKLSGAERGTAYHRIMEILDGDIYADENLPGMSKEAVSEAVERWLAQKVIDRKIPREYEEAVRAEDIAAFLLTDLGQRMARAFRNKKLMREKPFMMGIPASSLDGKFPKEEMVLIQGIIDAFFIEDDEIVLLDYKTDRVKRESELTDRYKIQLDYYKKALEAATKKKVKEVYIYSFALSKEIKLSCESY